MQEQTHDNNVEEEKVDTTKPSKRKNYQQRKQNNQDKAKQSQTIKSAAEPKQKKKQTKPKSSKVDVNHGTTLDSQQTTPFTNIIQPNTFTFSSDPDSRQFTTSINQTKCTPGFIDVESDPHCVERICSKFCEYVDMLQLRNGAINARQIKNLVKSRVYICYAAQIYVSVSSDEKASMTEFEWLKSYKQDIPQSISLLLQNVGQVQTQYGKLRIINARQAIAEALARSQRLCQDNLEEQGHPIEYEEDYIYFPPDAKYLEAFRSKVSIEFDKLFFGEEIQAPLNQYNRMNRNGTLPDFSDHDFCEMFQIRDFRKWAPQVQKESDDSKADNDADDDVEAEEGDDPNAPNLISGNGNGPIPQDQLAADFTQWLGDLHPHQPIQSNARNLIVQMNSDAVKIPSYAWLADNPDEMQHFRTFLDAKCAGISEIFQITMEQLIEQGGSFQGITTMLVPGLHQFQPRECLAQTHQAYSECVQQMRRYFKFTRHGPSQSGMMSQVVTYKDDEYTTPFYITPHQMNLGVGFRFSRRVDMVWNFEMSTTGNGSIAFARKLHFDYVRKLK